MSKIVNSIPKPDRSNVGRKPAHDYAKFLNKALTEKAQGKAVKLTQSDLPEGVDMVKFHSAMRRFGRSQGIQVVAALVGGAIYVQAGDPSPRVYTKRTQGAPAEVAEATEATAEATA